MTITFRDALLGAILSSVSRDHFNKQKANPYYVGQGFLLKVHHLKVRCD